MAKFCGNCGSRLEDDALFCENCGTSVGGGPAAPATQRPGSQPKAEKPPKNDKKAGIIAAVAAVIVIVVIIVVAVSGSSTVNLNDYVSISVEGYNGYGTAFANFDYAGFEQECLDMGLGSSDPNHASGLGQLGLLCFTGELDEDEYLSNGDTVTFQWTLDQDWIEQNYDIQLKYSDITQKVKDLTEVEEVDPFDGLEISFTGTNGYGQAELSVKLGAEFEDILWFSAESNGLLSNGDTLTVTAEFDVSNVEEYCAERYGKVPAAFEKDFTVDGLGDGEEFDPFEFIDVQFGGVAPNGTASAEIVSMDSRMTEVSLGISASEGLSNGDEVTVTLLPVWNGDEETLKNMWAKEGFTPTATSKTYTVEGLPEYVSALSQIPEETMNSMKAQTEDAFNAYVASEWQHPDSLNGITYLGAYLLTPKGEDFDTDHENVLTLVYTVNVTETVTENDVPTPSSMTYYYYTAFYDLLLDGDTCSVDLSSYSRPSDRFYKYDLYYNGYETLDELTKVCVTQNLETYQYESGIAEE